MHHIFDNKFWFVHLTSLNITQQQNQPDRRHPPNIHRAPAGACGKDMLPVPDPYRGGD